MSRTKQARSTSSDPSPLRITDASTQVFHQLCKINSESPKSNDLTQQMLPYANVHKLVKLWILKDMMQSGATSSATTTAEPKDPALNTLKERLHHLPHEIHFEIIKYIPTMDNNQDEWWVTYLKHRLISSSIRQHAEREIITRWNIEGLNLSLFLYSAKTNTFEKNAKFQILANLLKFQVYNETTNHHHLPPLPEEEPMENDDLSPQDDDDDNNAVSFYGSFTGADSSPVSLPEDDEAIMKQVEEQSESVTHLCEKHEMVMDEIMQELDGRAVKDFTIPDDDNCKLNKRTLGFYKNGLNHLIPYQDVHGDVHNASPPVEFSDNDSIKVLILPITDRLDTNTIALVASLKSLETLHIIYYGKGAEFLLQKFTYCHANTLKLTMLSPLSCTDAILSLGTRYNGEGDLYHSKVDLNRFPNLSTVHMEGILPDSFSMDEIKGDEDVQDLPSMEFHMANEHVAMYSSRIKADQPLQIHLSEFSTIPDWNIMIHSGIYVNPFHMNSGIERRDSLMGRILMSTQLSLSEKKQFIEDVMRHPGRGHMSACRDMSTSHNYEPYDDEEEVTPLERKCLMQWSIYCINKYHSTYKLFDTKLLHQFVEEEEKEQKLLYRLVAQCLLYGWNPQCNLLEALVVGVSNQKLSQPLMKMVEEKLQSDSGAFPLKDVQQVVGILLRKRNCLDGVKLIELVKKYHVDGCDLFKPDVKNGRGLLHLIFCLDLPMIVMENILQLVTPDDLLYVMDVKVARDRATVLTIGLYSNELTNEFLLKMIEKQPMLAHLPKYENTDDDNLPSLGKRSLLHYVVGDMRRWELIPILVEKYGCDVNVKDLSGRTPRDVAILLLNSWQLSLDYLPPCLQ